MYGPKPAASFFRAAKPGASQPSSLVKSIRSRAMSFHGGKCEAVTSSGVGWEYPIPSTCQFNLAPLKCPDRPLGNTGEMVSLLGIGGWHLGLTHVDESLSTRIVREAIDRA